MDLSFLIEVAVLIITFLEVALFASLLYHYVLLLAGIRMPSGHRGEALARNSFAFVIPAHDEDMVIGGTVRSLMAQAYPESLRHVYVVADYCSDATAEETQAAGGICLERRTGPRGRKAYALQWGLQQILASGNQYDAFVVIDADSHLHSRFLEEMNLMLERGYRVLQGQHMIINPADSPFAGLADVDMRINNFLRSQAKRNLGLSGRLMGDAMCFASDMVREFGWPTDSLGEDREYGIFLALKGFNTVYVPSAISYGQAVSRWQDAGRQRLRWYGGAGQIRKNRLSELLKQAIRLNPVVIDQLLELTLPAISISTLLSVLVAVTQVLAQQWGWLIPIQVTVLVAFLWLIFPFWGLLAARAPLTTFRALLYGPLYLVWRIGIGLRAFLGLGRIEWVRTKRLEELDHTTK